MACAYVHLSLLVSISPKSNRLHPLLGVPAEVADAADDVLEKEVEGFNGGGGGGVAG